MLTKKKQKNIIILIIAFFAISLVVVNYASWLHKKKTIKKNIITAGLSRGQEQYFQKELASAFHVSAYIQAGKRLFKKGDYDGALDSFQRAASASKLQGERSLAQLHLVSTYEKRHDYLNAIKYMVIVRDSGPEWSRKPNVERVIYLDNALRGEYELAVKHAEKALEEYMAIHRDMPLQKQEYIDRINDLKSAKDYILSLKKKE